MTIQEQGQLIFAAGLAGPRDLAMSAHDKIMWLGIIGSGLLVLFVIAGFVAIAFGNRANHSE